MKIATLLKLLGDEAIQIHNTFKYIETEDNNQLETILKAQLSDETFDQFLGALRQLLVSTCEFKEKDVLILDRIVLGINN